MQNYTECNGRGNLTDIKIRSNLVDTYWIIPEYETTLYGKVSLTRQDRRTFVAMFKDSRLIWAGRKPVHAGMEGN